MIRVFLLHEMRLMCNVLASALEDESDIENGRISFSSPLGRAIIGRKVGDEIVLNAPGGKRMYELVEIR